MSVHFSGIKITATNDNIIKDIKIISLLKIILLNPIFIALNNKEENKIKINYVKD